MESLRLFAKKPLNFNRPVSEETLPGHVQQVCLAADTLGELLAPLLQQAAVCGEEDIRHWKRAVWLAAWFHDWGKCNNHFQAMLKKSGYLQPVRHESISLWLVWHLRAWLGKALEGMPAWAISASFAAASGHHLKFPDSTDRAGAGYEAELPLDHPDFLETLEIGRSRFELPEAPELGKVTLNLLSGRNFQAGLKELERKHGTVLDELSEMKKTLVAAVKATLMAADLAGSAVPRTDQGVQEWVLSRLNHVLTPDQLRKVVNKKLGEKPLRPFQEKAAKTGANTVLVEAGCGGGKTAAAYLWAACKMEDRGGRLFFCYPTTVTASEGFGGYLKEPDFEALLVHSRVEADYRLLENLPGRGEETRELHNLRMEALETWPVPAVVCTVDTVLGLFENARRSLYAWPSLLRSVFVFDEIHSLDDRLFSYLLRFLRAFPGLPVLLMTATLPQERRKALEETAECRGGLAKINGKGVSEESPRYRLIPQHRRQAWEITEKFVREGGSRILWVCNTVNAAMQTWDEARERGLPVEMFHSRYRYKDRLARQKAIINGFQESKKPFLAVTTQVCEMSLDISADLLVTETAPVPSLIQRLGRLNRFDERPERPADALFIEPLKPGPYSAEELASLPKWMEKTCQGKPLSQGDLDEAFQEVCESGFGCEPAPFTALLDGLWYTQANQRSIREGGYTAEFVRKEDLGEGKPADYAIPMIPPKKMEWRSWEQEGRYWVAPKGSIHYDEFKGAQWNKN